MSQYHPAEIQADEEFRLNALKRLEILDTPPEQEFERLIKFATAIFDVPMALISLIDHDRQWFKAACGMSVKQIGREVGFCPYTILGEGVFVVPDATKDDRFANSPIVANPPHVRFYAGCPLKTHEGFKIGTFCILDTRSRSDFGEEKLNQLAILAEVTMDELALRTSQRELARQIEISEVALAKAEKAIAVQAALTQVEQALIRAESASHAKSTFLANMSHELRTPLNAIIGFSELMLLETKGPLGHPAYRQYAADILASGQHLHDIMSDILDHSKMEAGAIRVDLEVVDLRQVFAEYQRSVAPLVERKDITATICVPEPSKVVADPALLRRVVLNLLSNAIKFTPSGGEIRLLASADRADAVEICVEDTGVGMSEAEIAVALTPFGQVDASLSRRHEGTGLGLPIAKNLVELQGGQFAVTSKPGQGTKISFTLAAAPV